MTVESGVFIGPGAILTNDRYARAIRSDGELATADDWTVSEIRLEHGCAIGAGAIVVAGVRIGRFATVGAGAVVTRPVPEHGAVLGNPAWLRGWVCACGRPLTGDDGHPAGADAEAILECLQDGRRHEIANGRCSDVVPVR